MSPFTSFTYVFFFLFLSLFIYTLLFTFLPLVHSFSFSHFSVLHLPYLFSSCLLSIYILHLFDSSSVYSHFSLIPPSFPYFFGHSLTRTYNLLLAIFFSSLIHVFPFFIAFFISIFTLSHSVIRPQLSHLLLSILGKLTRSCFPVAWCGWSCCP